MSGLNIAVISAASVIIAAAFAAITAFVSSSNETKRAVELENKRIEAARILEMIKSPNPDQVAVNLDFLVNQVQLVTDPILVKNIQGFLKTRQPGTGPATQTIKPEGISSKPEMGQPTVTQGSPPSVPATP